MHGEEDDEEMQFIYGCPEEGIEVCNLCPLRAIHLCSKKWLTPCFSHYVRLCVVGRAGTRTFPQCSYCNRLFSKQQFSNGAAVGCAECMLLV